MNMRKIFMDLVSYVVNLCPLFMPLYWGPLKNRTNINNKISIFVVIYYYYFIIQIGIVSFTE